MDRRGFLKVAAMADTAALIPWRRAYAAFAQTLPLQKFVQPLRGLGGALGIPLATPNRSVYPGLDYYQNCASRIHRPAASGSAAHPDQR